MTHRRIHKYSALLAASLALPGAASAQPASSSCSGDNTMPSEQPGVTVVTSGTGHSRVIVQTDPDGTVRLAQHGKDHSAVAVQQGSGGSLSIDQSGASAQADVVQGGACNAARLSQAGSGNRATVSQSGSGNRVVVRQGPASGDAQ